MEDKRGQCLSLVRSGGMTKILNRALHDCIFRPPAVLTDTIECQEEIPDITDQLS